VFRKGGYFAGLTLGEGPEFIYWKGRGEGGIGMKSGETDKKNTIVS
jgi:hypothetical protein